MIIEDCNICENDMLIVEYKGYLGWLMKEKMNTNNT